MTPMENASHLQQTHSNGHGHAQRAQWSLSLSDGPRVTLQLPQQVSQVHVNLLYWLQKPEKHTRAHVMPRQHAGNLGTRARIGVGQLPQRQMFVFTCWIEAAGRFEDLVPDWLKVWSDQASPATPTHLTSSSTVMVIHLQD